MNRRTFLASSGTIASTFAGCTSLGRDPEPISRTFQTTTAELENPDHRGSKAIAEDGYSTFVNTMRYDREYDTAGVWGMTGERSNNGPKFVGALTEGLSYVGKDITSQHALAVYALDEEGPERRHQCWFWSGVDVSQVDERLHEIEIQFDAQSKRIAIGAYSPWGTFEGNETDQYDLDLSYTIGDGGIAASFPLPDGNVEVVSEGITIGPGGAVQTRWSGTMNDRYAHVMTCVAQWETGANLAIDWHVNGNFS